MRVPPTLVGLAFVGLVCAGLSPVQAQDRRTRDADRPISTADIQLLQDLIHDVSGNVSRLRQQDPQAADAIQGQLDSLREEAPYLKVKLRKEGSISSSEYWDVRDQLDSLRSQVRDTLSDGTMGTGGALPPSSYPQQPPYGTEYRQPTSSNPNEVPTGTELDVKLQQPLSSATAQVEDRFEATTVVDLTNGNGRVLIPAGSVVRGVVTSVDKATRTDRKGSLTLAFDQVRVRGRSTRFTPR